MNTHDDDISTADPLRLKIAGTEQELSTDERLNSLVEFVTELTDRIEALETHVTTLVRMSGNKGLGR